MVIAIGSFNEDTATEEECSEDAGIFYYCEDEADFNSLWEVGNCDGWKIIDVIDELAA